MDELVYVVAAPFKRNGVQSIPVKDFDFSLSFDLKWVSPQQAASLRDLAGESGLLMEKDGLLYPSFDTSAVSIPRGFHPSEDLLKQTSLIDKMLQYVSLCSGKNIKEVVAEVNNFQVRLSDMVDLEVAAFLVGQEMGCDMDVFYEKVQRKLST